MLKFDNFRIPLSWQPLVTLLELPEQMEMSLYMSAP